MLIAVRRRKLFSELEKRILQNAHMHKKAIKHTERKGKGTNPESGICHIQEGISHFITTSADFLHLTFFFPLRGSAVCTVYPSRMFVAYSLQYLCLK